MRESHAFVALDIGTSKVCALLVADDGSSVGRALAAGVAPSAGVRKGVIVGVEEVVQAIALAVRRAERQANREARGAVVSVAGAHLSSLNSRGVVALAAEPTPVARDDVARAVDAARAVLLPPDREIIHVLPRGYTVDGQRGIKNPVGLVGRRLDVEVHLVTAAATPVRNLEQCLRRAGVGLRAFVAQGLAAAEAVVSPEERELGVAVVDVGAGTCDIVVFVEGTPVHTAVLPVGGNNVTRDIAIGLRLPLDVAEELKLQFACADPRSATCDEMLNARTFGGALIEVSRRQLCEIVGARVDETLGLVRAEIARAGGARLLAAGCVLTGGAAELDGFAERAAEVLGMPVRVGQPRLPSGLGGTVDGPAYAAVAGLARWRFEDDSEAAELAARRGRALAIGRATGLAAGRAAAATLSPVAQRFAGWLRAFLPRTDPL